MYTVLSRIISNSPQFRDILMPKMSLLKSSLLRNRYKKTDMESSRSEDLSSDEIRNFQRPEKCDNTMFNNINYNFLDCDWFKKLLFSTNSLAKLLSDSSICKSHSKL